jgi:hypothetical protein
VLRRTPVALNLTKRTAKRASSLLARTVEATANLLSVTTANPIKSAFQLCNTVICASCLELFCRVFGQKSPIQTVNICSAYSIPYGFHGKNCPVPLLLSERTARLHQSSHMLHAAHPVNPYLAQLCYSKGFSTTIFVTDTITGWLDIAFGI